MILVFAAVVVSTLRDSCPRFYSMFEREKLRMANRDFVPLKAWSLE